MFVLRIIPGPEFELRTVEPFAGGIVFTTRFICRRISSGEGIPGVGVAPGFGFTFTFAGSGMPGVGVAPGCPGTFEAGILPLKITGLFEIPGGRFVAFRLTVPMPGGRFAAFAFGSGVVPQAVKTMNVVANNNNKEITFII